MMSAMVCAVQAVGKEVRERRQAAVRVEAGAGRQGGVKPVGAAGSEAEAVRQWQAQCVVVSAATCVGRQAGSRQAEVRNQAGGSNQAVVRRGAVVQVGKAA